MQGKCTHCHAGIVLHEDGMHRSLGWEVPCQRELTAEEERLMWKALLDGAELVETLTEGRDSNDQI